MRRAITSLSMALVLGRAQRWARPFDSDISNWPTAEILLRWRRSVFSHKLNAAFSEENNMPRVQRVNVALPEEQIAAMNAAVEVGEYATTGEVVRDALRDWQVKRERRSAEMERLRALWDEGLASGPMEPFDIDEIIADAKKRLPQVGAP